MAGKMPVAEMFSDELRDCVNEEDPISVYGMVVKNVVGDLLRVFSVRFRVLPTGHCTKSARQEVI